IRRFHVMEKVNNGPSAMTPGYTALTLLGGGQGFGAIASQNLFLSLL
ncbi:MAG TPA: flagellar protein, partial [Henriciella marina]|nr:flagellar protein [Henriciella marina]